MELAPVEMILISLIITYRILETKQSCELNPNMIESPTEACSNAEFLLQVTFLEYRWIWTERLMKAFKWVQYHACLVSIVICPFILWRMILSLDRQAPILNVETSQLIPVHNLSRYLLNIYTGMYISKEILALVEKILFSLWDINYFDIFSIFS